MIDETFMLHLLVSRTDGTQLVALPLLKGLALHQLEAEVHDILYKSDPSNFARNKEALDAAIRATSSLD